MNIASKSILGFGRSAKKSRIPLGLAADPSFEFYFGRADDTRETFDADPKRMIYDGRKTKIDGILSIGVQEINLNMRAAEFFRPHDLWIRTSLLCSPVSLKTVYGISDRDIWRIYGNSIARRMSFLGAFYYFTVISPLHYELGIGEIQASVVQSNVDKNPVESILDAFLHALQDIINDPNFLLIDPPAETRGMGNFGALSYRALDEVLKKDMATLISKGCIATAICHPKSGYASSIIRWAETNATRPESTKKASAKK
jgi:hypothetical protein